MARKDIYSTYGAALSSSGLTLYCYNAQLTTIEEIVVLEQVAILRAIQHQWHLFNRMQDFESGEEFVFSLN